MTPQELDLNPDKVLTERSEHLARHLPIVSA